eukprot:scaffold11477_cov129-Isochrysis_galbana.AAC.4
MGASPSAAGAAASAAASAGASSATVLACAAGAPPRGNVSVAYVSAMLDPRLSSHPRAGAATASGAAASSSGVGAGATGGSGAGAGDGFGSDVGGATGSGCGSEISTAAGGAWASTALGLELAQPILVAFPPNFGGLLAARLGSLLRCPPDSRFPRRGKGQGLLSTK